MHGHAGLEVARPQGRADVSLTQAAAQLNVARA